MLPFLLSGLSLGLAAGLSPGPLLALVIAQTLRHGKKEGIKVAFAPILSDVPVVLLCLFVLSRVSGLGPALAWMSIAGSVFVAYLGFESFRVSPADLAGGQAAPRSLVKAVAVNLLNPHVYLFWAAVGAPMVLKGLNRTDGAAFAFIGGFYFCLVGSKVLLALLIGRSRNVLTGRGYVITMRLLGILLFAMSIWMLVNGARDLRAAANGRFWAATVSGFCHRLPGTRVPGRASPRVTRAPLVHLITAGGEAGCSAKASRNSI